MKGDELTPPAPACPRRREIGLVLAVAALGVGLLFWTAGIGGGPFFSARPDGYYGLLTAGFREGHLYADIAPAPALLALKDPYDPVANAPYRVHDMVLWRGRYYLYHGVTPVLIFFWPIVAMTGRYPSEPFAVAAFCALAFLAATALLAAIRRRHFPAAPLWTLVACESCMALASPLSSLVAGAQFYEVPIACAACLQMLMFGALFLSLNSERRATAWLAAASLLFGLSVGARPDYILGGFGLLVPLCALARGAQGGRRAWIRLGLAAFVPAGLFGAGLLFYNWARFGSVFEFGMRYQLAGESLLHRQFLSLTHLVPHVGQYLFRGGIWERYFPFFRPPVDEAYGIARYLPWCWLVPVALLPLAGARRKGGYRSIAAAVFVCSAANLVLLSCFFGSVRRYMADYATGFLLLAGLGALWTAARFSRGGVHRLVRFGVGAAAAVSVFVGMTVFALAFPRQQMLFGLARNCDRPAAWWERMTGRKLGGLRLDLQLPAGRDGVTEPIFETGAAADRRDWMQMTYLPGGRARIGIFHAGLGLVAGRPFAVPADRRIRLDVCCGSLLPPFEHPVFASWTRDDYERTSRDVRVDVDGAQVLRAALACYPAPPQDLRIGARGWIGDGVADRFSGRVLSWRRLPIERDPPPVAIFRRRAPIELTVVFPADRASGSEPLVAVGRGPLSDLFYCIYDGPGRVRFALDHADAGGPEGEDVAYDPTRLYRLKLWMGSLSAPDAGPSPERVSPSGRGVAWMEGSVVLNEEGRFTAGDPETVRLGINPFRSTVIARRFTGLILGVGQSRETDLPPLRYAGRFGAVDAEVVFPQGASGTAEPLVVTGETGAGDALYVKYLDADHVSFGFDHWGVGGAISPPTKVDFGRAHRLEITLGSLYPPGKAGSWSRRVRVEMDGAVVLDEDAACYPTRADEIFIGRNTIGGSTCGPAFTGRIFDVVRTPSPP